MADNDRDGKKNPLLVYGTLLGAVAAALVTYFDYQTGRRLATDPRARPEAFTASDGKQLRTEFNEKLRNIDENFTREIDRLHRTLETQQSQILYLYERQHTDD